MLILQVGALELVLSWLHADNHVGHEIGATYLFRDNLPRLQALKKKYDPHNVFSKWHDLVSHTERQP